MQTERQRLSSALRVLGVADDADLDTITRAYRRLARTTHPDISEATDAATQFDVLTGAYRQALAARQTSAQPSRPQPGQQPTARSTTPGFGRAGGFTIVVGPARVEPVEGGRAPGRRRMEPQTEDLLKLIWTLDIF